MPADGRENEMLVLYCEEGLTYEEIGKRYDLSRQRVGQLLDRADPDGSIRDQARVERREEPSGPDCRQCGKPIAVGRTGPYCSEACYEDAAPHGTTTRYARGCRCEKCREANTQRHRSWIERARAEFEAGEREIEHGTASSYINYGCRCLPCTQANSEASA